MPRNKQKNLARSAAHRAEKAGQQRFERKIEAALTGCSDRVLKAVTQAPNWRGKAEKEIDLVSRENPEYRKVMNESGRQIHAKQKMRGKSIPAYYD